jgi:excinuclease ABC subunit B
MEGAHAGAPVSPRRYARVAEEVVEYAALSPAQMARRIRELEKQMYQHARDLEFEQAARVRDKLRELQAQGTGL